MATAARAYRYDAAPAQPRRERNTQVRVVPGTRQADAVSPLFVTVVKAAFAVLMVFAVVACVRVWFTAATVNTLLESQVTSSQVDQIRSSSESLQVQKSVLASPSHVKERASQMGLVEASSVESVTLDTDVVTYDGQGNLSLSASLSAAAGI